MCTIKSRMAHWPSVTHVSYSSHTTKDSIIAVFLQSSCIHQRPIMPIVQLANTIHSPRALGHWTAQSLTGSCHLSLASISQPTLDMDAGGSASNNTCPSQICKAGSIVLPQFFISAMDTARLALQQPASQGDGPGNDDRSWHRAARNFGTGSHSFKRQRQRLTNRAGHIGGQPARKYLTPA